MSYSLRFLKLGQKLEKWDENIYFYINDKETLSIYEKTEHILSLDDLKYKYISSNILDNIIEEEDPNYNKIKDLYTQILNDKYKTEFIYFTTVDLFNITDIFKYRIKFNFKILSDNSFMYVSGFSSDVINGKKSISKYADIFYNFSTDRLINILSNNNNTIMGFPVIYQQDKIKIQKGKIEEYGM